MYRLRIILLGNECIEYFVQSVFLTGNLLMWIDDEGNTCKRPIDTFRHFKVVKYVPKH